MGSVASVRSLLSTPQSILSKDTVLIKDVVLMVLELERLKDRTINEAGLELGDAFVVLASSFVGVSFASLSTGFDWPAPFGVFGTITGLTPGSIPVLALLDILLPFLKVPPDSCRSARPTDLG